MSLRDGISLNQQQKHRKKNKLEQRVKEAFLELVANKMHF